jgi:hypothetical protein
LDAHFETQLRVSCGFVFTQITMAEVDYEDQVFHQLPLGPAIDEATAKSQLAARKAAVEKALNGNDIPKALELALADTPFTASSEVKV